MHHMRFIVLQNIFANMDLLYSLLELIKPLPQADK